MALQGDLSSFALADVLRLLAGTAKTGALEVSSTSGAGEVWMRDGAVVGGAVPGAPHATRAADVVLELLRFDGGSFAFDDLIDITEEGGVSVEETLDEAEALLAEWHDVEQVVPSMEAWTTLADELNGDDVTVSAADWRVLAAIGGGVSVRGLASRRELTDLAASRQVKGLVEQGVVAIRADAGTPSAETEPEPMVVEVAAEHPDPAAEAPEADLAILRSDDRPVVLGAGEGDLLPEPLLGEDADLGDLDVEFPGSDERVGDIDRAPAMAGGNGNGDGGVAEDDERGSLLRFLSTTKP